MGCTSLRADLVIGDPEGIHGGEIPLLFKIELREDFSPLYPLEIPDHQISPKGKSINEEELVSYHSNSLVLSNRELGTWPRSSFREHSFRSGNVGKISFQ
jgi:hypothetical protein